MKVSPVNNTEQSEGNEFIRKILRYLPYWPLFVGLVFLSMGSAWLYLRYAIPIYESTATILIKDENKGIDDSRMLESLDLLSSKKIIENEMEIIRSRAVMKEVVKKLGLYAPIFHEGKIKTVLAYLQSPVKVEVRQPDSLIEQDKVYFEFDKDKSQVIIGEQTYPLNQWVKFPYGELRFVPNNRHRPTGENLKLFFYLMDVRKVANGMIGGLQILPASKSATVLYLKLYDPVPERGEDILNGLIREYNYAAIEDKNKLAANALALVEERLKFVVSELDSVESVMQRYKVDKGIVDISSQGKLFLESVESNDKKISEISVQLAILDQVERYIRDHDPSSSSVPSTLGLSDGILSGLLEKLSDAEIQYERLKQITAENNPILISVKNQIEKIKPSILENVRSQRRNLEAGRSNLNSTSGVYSSRLRTIPQKERELLDITRQQSIKNNIYTFLLQKREEAALSFAASVPDSRLVDNAQSAFFPVSPKRSLIYGIALLFGLGVGVAFLFVKDMLNQTINYRSEIEAISSFPIIGDIAYESSKRPIVIASGERTVIAEQFRQVRTSLSYLGINSVNKKILVTSAVSGEGKSFVAANLAISLALTDKKVALLELDLRKPKLSQVFQDTNATGLSDYLMGKVEAERIIRQTLEDNNLYLIPSGPIPENPSELILNGRLEQLLAYLDKRFDYIVLETAPVNVVTDASIVSRFCDATLCIVRHGVTRKSDLKMLEANLKVRKLNNAAIIFNGIRTKKANKDAYAYGEKYKLNGVGKKKKISEVF